MCAFVNANTKDNANTNANANTNFYANTNVVAYATMNIHCKDYADTMQMIILKCIQTQIFVHT